jgi:hypothetical protein
MRVAAANGRTGDRQIGRSPGRVLNYTLGLRRGKRTGTSAAAGAWRMLGAAPLGQQVKSG